MALGDGFTVCYEQRPDGQWRLVAGFRNVTDDKEWNAFKTMLAEQPSGPDMC
jgi:hypothetical protein